LRNIEEIIVNKVALNVLDRENNTVILTEKELELTEEVYEYFESHLLKLLKDEEAKPAFFGEEKNIVKDLCKEIFEDEEQFVDNSNKLSQYLFRCIGTDEKESSGDMAVCHFESQEGKYIAILKLNFTNSYCHYVKDSEGKPMVTVGVNRTGLPSLGQKVSKAVIIREFKDDGQYNMLVLDKDREGVFINSFLKCTFTRDRRENTKIISRISEQFARKAFKDNAQEAERFRSRLSDHLRNEDSFDVQKVAEENFSDIMVKNEFKAVIASEGITENEVPIDREWAGKKLKRKRLKVDKSIELYIDSEVYNDKEKFQIKRNGDGTIDIILKNVKNYIER
jgi:hypothetical protein